MGQRDSVWLRISKTRDAGFTIAHLGTVLVHKLKNDFLGERKIPARYSAADLDADVQTLASA